MGDKTGIEWTDATWNPVVGCSIHSPGCKNCYAMPQSARMERMGVAKYAGLTDIVKDKAVFNGTVRLVEEALDQPLRWKRPRRIFVNSMSDLGHEALARTDVFQVLEIMHFAYWHVFQVLTKRPQVLFEHLLAYEPKLKSGCVPPHMAFVHVWFGVSVEDQARADERLAYAKQLDEAGYRVWVSYEPAIGPVDWTGWEFIAGMVSGGESGPQARPTHPDWHRNTRDWCAQHGIPYDFKQWGEWRPTPGVDVFCHGPKGNARRFPKSEGISMLADGRVCMRDFSVAQHARRIKERLARTDRAIEVDAIALADFTASIKDPDRPTDNPTGYQWLYRVGKQLAGNLLDGQAHDGFTRACAPAGRT